MTDKQYIPPPLETDPHPYFPPLITNGVFSPSGTFEDVYIGPTFNHSPSQHTPAKLQENMFPYQDVVNWENIKLPEKIDLIEITSKDLSPFSNNIELLTTDSTHIKYDQNWFSTTQTNSCHQQKNDFPSCAEANKVNSINVNMPSYCAIQKTNDIVEKSSCAYYNNHENIYFENNRYMTNYSNLCNKTCSGDSNYFLRNEELNYAPIIPPIDQQAELSNDESDIVVEDSEDDQTDFSEEPEKNSNFQTNRCLICNTTYMPMGVQFYFLTSRNPLTMTTQVPVVSKILKVIGRVCCEKKFLCSKCLGLVNTIDHLQKRLDEFTDHLVEMFRNTCFENRVPSVNSNTTMKPKFPRYRCKRCRKVLYVKTFCENHLQTHKSTIPLCEICGKIFKSVKKFKAHFKYHKNRKLSSLISSFKCSNLTCEKTFRTRSNLKEHENFCLGILPFKCKKCFKKFPSSTKLKNHIKLKHDKKFVAICSICNIGFTKVSDYKSHMTSHCTDKKFSCKKCGRTYKTLSNLNFHMKIHEKRLPFQCEICSKGFMRKEYLESHVNNHKDVKNYACPSCDKKFTSQKNLDAHSKYHDSNLKRITCNVCHKILSNDLKEHLRVHSNLREFECEICEMRFNTKNTLNKHKKRKHSE